MRYKLKIADEAFEVEVGDVSDGLARVSVNGTPYDVNIENLEQPAPAPQAPVVQPPAPRPAPAPAPAAPAGAGAVTAPIPGLLLQVKVSVGDAVTAGQSVAIVEAMKMENDIPATASGTVTEIHAKQGEQVSTGEVILIIS